MYIKYNLEFLQLVPLSFMSTPGYITDDLAYVDISRSSRKLYSFSRPPFFDIIVESCIIIAMEPG